MKSKFIVGGDFNAKNPWWGSRLTNPKGRQLLKCIHLHNYSTLSSGTPTYWPTDPRKIPDVLDFVVYLGIPSYLLDIKHSDELSSDHSPVLFSYRSNVSIHIHSSKLITNRTDIDSFQYWLDKRIQLNIRLKESKDIEQAVENFSVIIHEAAFLSTPQLTSTQPRQMQISTDIRKLIEYKRKLRRNWHKSHNPLDKKLFNKATRDLKLQIREFKNKSVQEYLKNLNCTSKNDETSIWIATKYLKRPAPRNFVVKDSMGKWCRSNKDKAQTFGKHLTEVFKPFERNSSLDNDIIKKYLDTPCLMDLPIKHIRPSEVRTEINKLGNRKTPGYDAIDTRVAKSLSKKGILFLTLLYNSIIRLNYFPTQWKVAEIIMIRKQNKPEGCLTSYRPISLLSTFSKVFERILLRRLLPLLEMSNILPEHQFGFREKHGTHEQCHRIVNAISDSLERKEYTSAIFLDVHQAFDKVWHAGLLFKIKKLLPQHFFLLFKSYLSERYFYVKVKDECSDLHIIEAGIPQGSVLGPVLYTIYTSDMPVCDRITVATYADDTSFLASSDQANTASALIQDQLNILDNWLKKWNIRVNTEKSKHITFALRKGDCPAVSLDGSVIPHVNSVKYLGLHLDRRLTWKNHIKAKRQQLNYMNKKLFWLIGPKSLLSLENKVRIYKAFLKPIWTYGIQLWGTASHSNIEILQRYQSKTLRMIANAPWFVTNDTIHNDLGLLHVKNVITKYSEKYLDRLSMHVNPIAICLLDETNEIKRLKRHHVLDLPFRK